MACNLKMQYEEAVIEFQGEFHTSQEKIIDLLEYFKKCGENICIWGIGRKALGFVGYFDPDNIYIDKLIDISDEKLGCILPTGHVIEDPKALKKEDIILVVCNVRNLIEMHMLNNFSHPGSIRVLELNDYIEDKYTLADVKNGSAFRRKKYFETNNSIKGERTGDLISVVLPTYNGERYIRESIDSVLGQTYKNIELIIVNDASTDNTKNIIDEYVKEDSRVRIIDNPVNLRLPKSLNVGFKAAQGRLHTWTSDDNVYKPYALEKMYDAMMANNVNFVFSDITDIDEDGYIFCDEPSGPVEELSVGNVIGACFLYKGFFFNDLKGYREDRFCAEDYDFWLRVFFDNAGSFHHIKESLYYYRRHAGTLTSNKRRLICETTAETLREYLPLIRDETIKKRSEEKIAMYEEKLLRDEWDEA